MCRFTGPSHCADEGGEMGGELCLVHSWLLMADAMFNGG